MNEAIVRVTRALSSPPTRVLVIIAAVLLVLPSISAGLGSDDFVIGSQLRTPRALDGLSRGALDLFVFAPGDASRAHALLERGVFPWWADLHAKIAFFRPLASATHALDHALAPASPRAWHLHSIAWFALSLVAVAALYRRVFGAAGRSIATLALIFFALDDAHGAAVGWLCARNGLMALTFAAFALVAHARLREDGWRPGKILGPTLFALALLSGEAALGACAYLVGYALFLDDGPPPRRLARLGGFGAVLGLWAVAYVGLGYGTSGTSQYLDPLREPAAFVTQAAQRLPVLLLGQVLGPWSDLWPLYAPVAPALPYAVLAFAAVVLAWVALSVTPRLREDRVARFFAFGMVVSLVPVCAGLPSDRVLLFAGIGGMGLAAQVGPR